MTISSLSATLLCMYVYIYIFILSSVRIVVILRRKARMRMCPEAADARVQKIARSRAGPEAVCLLPAAAATSALCMCPERRQWQSKPVQGARMQPTDLWATSECRTHGPASKAPCQCARPAPCNSWPRRPRSSLCALCPRRPPDRCGALLDSASAVAQESREQEQEAEQEQEQAHT